MPSPSRRQFPGTAAAAMAYAALAGALGLRKPAATNRPHFLTADVPAAPIRLEHGLAHVPRGPVLGIEVDEDRVTDLMKRSGGDKLLKG